MSEDLDLERVGRNWLKAKGYAPAMGGPAPLRQPSDERPWLVCRRRSDFPDLKEFVQDSGVPGVRLWGDLFNAKRFNGFKDAQAEIKLLGDGLAVRERAMRTMETKLEPSALMTLDDLGL